MISFFFRGISLPRNNLSFLWAFSTRFGAYLKITQAKDKGLMRQTRSHQKLTRNPARSPREPHSEAQREPTRTPPGTHEGRKRPTRNTQWEDCVLLQIQVPFQHIARCSCDWELFSSGSAVCMAPISKCSLVTICFCLECKRMGPCVCWPYGLANC